MNRRGEFSGDVLDIVIMGGILLGILGVFWIYSLVMPIISDSSNSIKTEILGVNASVGEGQAATNFSTVASYTVNPINDGIQASSWVGYTMLFCLIIVFLIMCYNAPGKPWMIAAWVAIIVAVTFVSAIMSNSYQDIAANDSRYENSSWSMNNFLMGYLPYISVALGVIGGIIMLSQITKDPVVDSGGITFG